MHKIIAEELARDMERRAKLRSERMLDALKLRDYGQDMSREHPIRPVQPTWEEIEAEFPGYAND